MKISLPRTLTIMFLLTLSFSLMGCNSQGTIDIEATAVETIVATETEAVADVPAVPSGELKIAHGETLDSLDPQAFSQIYAINIATLLYDPLVSIAEDGTVEPVLAASWEQVDDLTWKFNFRPSVKYQNGDDFTCESVKYTLDRVVNPETGSAFAGIWADYDHTDCQDDLTAIVVTKKPLGTMLSNLALTVILPASAGSDFDFSSNANGTGPYKLVSWSQDGDLVMEANAEYWGDVPKTQKVIFKNIPEDTTRVTAFETGEVDLIWGLGSEEAARLAENNDLEIVTYPTYYLRFLWMNAGVKPFDDPLVREAMRYAIDIPAIIDSLFTDQAIPATGCIAKGVIGYCEQPAFTYDPEKAKSLLAEAGYPNGFETEIKFTDNLPKQKELAQTISAYLSEVGINAAVVPQDQSVWVQELLALDWQLNLAGTTTITGDGDFTLSRIYLTSANRTGYSNAEVDELLTQQKQIVNLEEREDMMCQVCNTLWNEGPTVWLFNSMTSYGIHDYVKGFEPQTNQILDVSKIYVEK